MQCVLCLEGKNLKTEDAALLSFNWFEAHL